MEINRATVHEISTLLPLVAEYWRFENLSGFEAERVAAQLTRLFSTPGLGVGWLAVAEGVPVGYLLAVYVFSLEHLGLTAEIDELFVLPAQRGQGVGGELLRLAELEFTKAGCTNVALQLSRRNDDARAFYRRHAYRERSGYELLDKLLPDR
jgi:GNAT superfamily N-acetyltransferase